jgi:penicillin-binding protein 1A
MDQIPEYIGNIQEDMVVITTLRPEWQGMAEKAINDVMDKEGESHDAKQAALVAMTPDGAVRAMIGGRSYAASQYNRATQALRQPGSSFKPLVYAAALDNGYTPSTVVMDAPLEIDTGSGVWKPENYEGKFYGPSTLRFGIERSRNVMTVRLAQDIGMPMIGEYAKRFGVYDSLPPYLSFALGAGETTLMRMVGAYAMFDNGGKKVQPTLIDRIQDRYGRTVYKHDARECRGCAAPKWDGQPEPTLIDRRDRVIDQMTAYQITSIMEGVVQRGTATVVRSVGKPIAGKTGTTNDEKDVWFIGFSPDLVVGVFMGYDKPRHIGNRATGGALAAPIFPWRKNPKAWSYASCRMEITFNSFKPIRARMGFRCRAAKAKS